MPDLSPLDLGPTLYMPALRSDLAEVGNGHKYKNLRSLIYCTEDSILESDLSRALDSLAKALPRLDAVPINRFIRPRRPEVLARLLDFKGLANITGFVIPKADLHTLPDYFAILEAHEGFSLMITLETEAAFDLMHMYRLRDFLAGSHFKERIAAIRIGVQDLLSLLGLRREPGNIIYETPLGVVTDQLLTIFRPAGFDVVAPAFEYLNAPDLLLREIRADISRALYGKTALHPEQLEIIASAYKVSPQDLKAAGAVLDPERPATFRLHDRIYEKAVHTNWAHTIEKRARIYGTHAQTQ